MPITAARATGTKRFRITRVSYPGAFLETPPQPSSLCQNRGRIDCRTQEFTCARYSPLHYSRWRWLVRGAARPGRNPPLPRHRPRLGGIDRTVLPIREPQLSAHHRARRAQGDAAAALRGEGARRRAERAHRPHRRHGLRHVERVRRADPHADRRAPGERGAALQPVPHDGALLADAHGVAQRPQPPHEQHGRRSRKRPPRFRATRVSAPTTSRRSPRCCG